MSGPETRLQQRIQKELRKKYGEDIWLFKVHGGRFQEAGIPDIVGCLRGWFFALEVKHPDEDHPVTALQEEQMTRIYGAGGITAVVESVEEALLALEQVPEGPA